MGTIFQSEAGVGSEGVGDTSRVPADVLQLLKSEAGPELLVTHTIQQLGSPDLSVLTYPLSLRACCQALERWSESAA